MPIVCAPALSAAFLCPVLIAIGEGQYWQPNDDQMNQIQTISYVSSFVISLCNCFGPSVFDLWATQTPSLSPDP